MRVYGLIGYPLSHSFSQRFFSQKFEREGVRDTIYENFPIASIDEFSTLISNPDLYGLNVTIPYKEKVIPFLHDSTDTVKRIGACNCIKIEEGKLTGHNTDVTGFETSLLRKWQLHHNKALILGTGGAAKAIAFVLEKLHISYLTVSRSASPSHISYEQVTPAILKEHLLIINTTPLGMYPNVDGFPALDYNYITGNHFLFDIIYNPEQTLFLKKGAEKGAVTENGKEMLVIQAEESWKIWNNLT